MLLLAKFVLIYVMEDLPLGVLPRKGGLAEGGEKEWLEISSEMKRKREEMWKGSMGFFMFVALAVKESWQPVQSWTTEEITHSPSSHKGRLTLC